MTKAKQNAIINYGKKIMKANQRLGNLYKKFGPESKIYQDAEIRIRQQFESMGAGSLISTGPTGAIKVDKKKAEYFIANQKRNVRNILSGSLGSVQTIAQIKLETAKKLNLPKSRITIEQMEAVHQVKSDFKSAIQALYNMIQGDSYRKILVTELYSNNHGKVDTDKISALIGYYENHADYIKSASAAELKELRKGALTKI